MASQVTFSNYQPLDRSSTISLRMQVRIQRVPTPDAFEGSPMLKEHTVRRPSDPGMSEDEFLHALVDGRVPVAISLKTGIRLQGEIESYEPYGLLLRGISQQFLYTHEFSPILQSRDVSSSHRPSEGDALIERRATT